MARFEVDGSRQRMLGTGVVAPVEAWGDGPEGKRVRTGEQATTDDGRGLYAVEVLVSQTEFGRDSTVVVRVEVPCESAPTVPFGQAVAFEGLTADVRVDRRTGGLSTRWAAAGIASAPAAASGRGAGRSEQAAA